MFPMLLKNKSAYHYMGSLTTPPCAEIVTWFVYTEAFPLTNRNFDAIKQQINGGSSNSRTVQNLNGRNVELVGGFCNPMIKKA
jgi:carbonic anhydrase